MEPEEQAQILMKIQQIRNRIESRIYDLSDEKATQDTIDKALSDLNPSREHRLSKEDVVDFLIDNVAVEVKTQGQATAILRQCSKYCEYEDVEALVLVTSRSMGFPQTLHGKPCYYISLSQGML